MPFAINACRNSEGRIRPAHDGRFADGIKYRVIGVEITFVDRRENGAGVRSF